MKFIKPIIMFLLLIGTISVSAQSSLSGKITDIQNKSLLGVAVYSAKFHKGTTTDENGNYILKNLPNGKVKITFTYVGYKTIEKTFDFNSENKTFDIQLKENVFAIDEVIISTPFNQLQSENVAKVDRISAKAIQRSGATTLIRGLSSIPGVSQVSTGVAIGKPVIRGMSSNQIVVYTQGIRLENQQFGGEHGLAINDAGIASAEVIKGPASLLYGSDAIGGVLYLNPEHFSPQGKTQFDVNQRFESNTVGSNTSFAVKTSTNNWKFLARGTYALHADYKIPTGKRVTNTRFKEKDIKAGIGFHKNNFLSEIRYNYNETFLGMPDDGIDKQTKVYTPAHPYQKIYNHILSWKNQITFKNSKLEGEFGYIHNDRNEFEEGDNPSLEMVLKTLSYNVKYHLPKFGKLKTIFGVQGMHQTNTNFADEFLIPDAKVNDFGVFAVGNYPLDENNTIEAGIRFDNRAIDTQKGKQFKKAVNKSFNSFTASLGYKTNPFENFTARFNVATGFRSPNLAELSSNGVHEGTQRFEKGNNDLKVEKNMELDLSLEYKTSHFELFASPFYNKIDNYIYTAPTGKTIQQEDEDTGKMETYQVYDFSQNDAKLYGGEFGFHLHPHPLDWLHLESSFETVIGKETNGKYLPLVPANTWKNTIRANFNSKNWLKQGYALVGLNDTFAQNKVGKFETKTDGYFLVNLGFGGDILLGKHKFNTSISVNNLLDKKYYNHLSRLKPDPFGLRPIGLLNPGRNIVMSINFKI